MAKKDEALETTTKTERVAAPKTKASPSWADGITAASAALGALRSALDILRDTAKSPEDSRRVSRLEGLQAKIRRGIGEQ